LDHTVADLMNSYWVNFATTGNPNGKGLPAWPVYSTKEDQNIAFGDKTTIATGLNREQLDFFDKYYEDLRTKK
jgi:para-nitrobenzyl esterase